jgi:5'-3' exonuclease
MRRMLLDTASLTYRAFHALPESLTDAQGQPIGGVRGVLDMHARLIGDHAPGEVVHVFDADWRPQPRVALCPSYKAHRPPEPEAITAQFTLLRQVLDGLGLARAEAPGWEADDAIAALALGAEAGEEVLIVSGDRDLLQLVRDGDAATATVQLLYTQRGVTDLAVFDAAAVRAAYGVAPERYADYAALRGDPSDGLPGLAGAGAKTARGLVERYGDVDTLIAHAHEQTPALARNLDAGAEALRATKRVVALRGEVEVDVVRPEPHMDRVAALARAHSLEGPVGRLARASGLSSPTS